VTKLVFVFRQVILDTVSRGGSHVTGQVQVEGTTPWMASPYRWVATRGPDARLLGLVSGTTISTSAGVIEDGKTVYVGATGVIARVPTPGTTGVSFVFDVGGTPLVFEQRLNEFALEPGQVHDLTVNVKNLDQENAHSLTGLSVIGEASGLTVEFVEPLPKSVAAGATVPVALRVDATGAQPGTTQELLGKCVTDGDPERVDYTVLRFVIGPGGSWTDLEVTSEDLTFDPLPGVPGEESTLSATVRNVGTQEATNVVVVFKDFDQEIGRQTIGTLLGGESATVSVTHTWAEDSVRLITVVVDPENAIAEFDETNNSASKTYQVGEPPPMAARIVVSGGVPAGLEEGTIGTVSGQAFYEILVGGKPNYEFPVKGGAVTVVITHPAGGEVYRLTGFFTDTLGGFRVPFPVPGRAGDVFNLAITVTDGTLTGRLETSFRVVGPPPPPPPPGPGPGPVPQTDLWVHSEDIGFSDWNPDLGETITIGAVFHASPDNPGPVFGVPITFTAHHPTVGDYQIGRTLMIEEMRPGASQAVSTTWRNAAEGIYLLEAALGPDFRDDNNGNNAATRAIVVGQLNGGLQVTFEAPVSGTIVENSRFTEVRVKIADTAGNVLLPGMLDSATLQFSGAYEGSVDLKSHFDPVKQRYVFQWQPPSGTSGRVDLEVLAQAVVGENVLNGSDETWVQVVDEAGPTFQVRARPEQAPLGQVVEITVDASEPLRNDRLESIAVTDSAGQSIGLAGEVYHPWSTRWVYRTEPLPEGTAEGEATIGVAGVDRRGHGGSGEGRFEVIVNRPPTAEAGVDQAVEQDGAAGASVTLDGSQSSDPDGDALTYTWRENGAVIAGPSKEPTARVTLPLGEHAIELTVEDGRGGQDTDTLTVTVQDTTAPALQVPTEVRVEQETAAGTKVEWTCTATDICDAQPDVTCDPPSGTVFALGTHTVRCTATDASGNVATKTFTVTVVDTTEPTLTPPPDVTVEQTSADGTPVELGQATATDICDADVSITNDAPAVFPLGETVVTWTATDDSGNVATATQRVTIVDTTPSQVALSTAVTSLWPANHDLVDVGLRLTVADICDADPVITLSVTQDEPVEDQGGDGNFSPDAKILTDADGKVTGLRLRAERKGNGDGRVYLIIATVTDASGNVTQKCCAVTVPKSQSQKDKDAVAAQAAAAVAAGVPLAYDSTAGPVVGPKQ